MFETHLTRLTFQIGIDSGLSKSSPIHVTIAIKAHNMYVPHPKRNLGKKNM